MTNAPVRKFHCGEVYATENLCVILKCNLCNEQFGIYTQFLDHIFGKHYEDWIAAEKYKNASEESSNAKEPKEFITDEQYLEIDVTNYPSTNDLGTELLQQIEEEVIPVENITEEELQSQPKLAREVSYENARPVRAFQKLSSTKERKYKCKVCGFAVADICNLRSHELRHSSIKPFACLKCDKGFYTRTELNTHTRRHNAEKPFVCTYCGNGFVSIAILNKHEKRHTGNRPHKCDQCDKSFYDASQLKHHYVVHTQERNFSCEKCQSKFSRKKSLRTHMKLHENALQYKCVICLMRFNQRPTLLWHIKSKHNVVRADGDGL